MCLWGELDSWSFVPLVGVCFNLIRWFAGLGYGCNFNLLIASLSLACWGRLWYLLQPLPQLLTQLPASTSASTPAPTPTSGLFLSLYPSSYPNLQHYQAQLWPCGTLCWPPSWRRGKESCELGIDWGRELCNNTVQDPDRARGPVVLSKYRSVISLFLWSYPDGFWLGS